MGVLKYLTSLGSICWGMRVRAKADRVTYAGVGGDRGNSHTDAGVSGKKEAQVILSTRSDLPYTSRGEPPYK